MDVNMTDREQVEAITQWWKNYGKTTIFLVLFAVLVNMGWGYYQKRQVEHSEYASLLYTKMLSSYVQNNTKEFTAQADYLTSNFPDVPYASFANFALAKQYVEEGKLTEALDKLNDVITHEHTSRIIQIAQIRSARILLAQDKTDEALHILSSVKEKSFMPLVNEVRGDIYVAKGDPAKARREYQDALSALPVGEVNRNLLQMKFEQLADSESELV